MLSVQLSPWPRGNVGAQKSISKVAEFVARDRLDARTREWAINQVKDAGNPQSDIGKAKVIYDAIKRDKIYVLDPYDSEMMQSAVCTLDNCDGITFNGGDCDDLTISYLSAVGALGIPVAVVGHSYSRSGDIGHVLGAFWDSDSEKWVTVDTTIDLPFGQTHKPTRERWLNVPDGKVICDNSFCYRGMHPPNMNNSRLRGDFVGIVDLDSSQNGFIVEKVESIKAKQWIAFGAAMTLAATASILFLRSKKA